MTGTGIDSALTVVLGHAASGKSAWAERMVEARPGGRSMTYVATARILDAEMAAKVERHTARRRGWDTLEAQTDLAAACRGRDGTVLIDCATMWLTNLAMDGTPWEDPLAAWIAAMRTAPARFWVVSNDVGGGVTPDNAMARAFQRMQGEANQRLAAAADHVVLVTAGLPQWLKGGP